MNYELAVKESIAYANSGSIEQAIGVWDQYMRLNENCEKGLFARGKLRTLAAGQESLALEDFIRAGGSDSASVQMRLACGEQLEKLKEESQAIQMYSNAIEIARSYDGDRSLLCSALHFRGLAYGKSEETMQQSLDDFLEATQIDPADGFSHLRMAVNQHQLGELNEAEISLLKAEEHRDRFSHSDDIERLFTLMNVAIGIAFAATDIHKSLSLFKGVVNDIIAGEFIAILKVLVDGGLVDDAKTFATRSECKRFSDLKDCVAVTQWVSKLANK